MGYVQGRLIASPLSRGSGIVSSFMKADGILNIPQGLEGYRERRGRPRPAAAPGRTS